MRSLSDVTDATFAEQVLAADRPVLVDFWAEWCPPCGPVAKILAELADEFDSRFTVVKLNADHHPVTVREYRVLAMPTLLFFSGGSVVRSIVGARPKSVLRQAMADVLTPYVNR